MPSVAFIPARAGSERVKHKNIQDLGGHPVLAYSIAAARQSGCFDAVIVSTDSEKYAAIARHYGAEVPFLRPAEIASSTSPDIEWVQYTLRRLAEDFGRPYDIFSILRPTSPFRQAATIQRAMTAFLAEPPGAADSLRAVEKVKQHPGKMWVIRGKRLLPLLPFTVASGVPWHSSQMKALPEVFVQNASLEIAWTRIALENGTIAGDTILPFLTEGAEGEDLNDPQDWFQLNHLIAHGEATLPHVPEPPYFGEDVA
jgi:CMP-N,N'-diacetyllegionaminic acid synthase